MIIRKLAGRQLRARVLKCFGGGSFKAPEQDKEILKMSENKSISMALGIYNSIDTNPIDNSRPVDTSAMSAEVESQNQIMEAGDNTDVDTSSFEWNFKKFRLFTGINTSFTNPQREEQSGEVVNERPHGYAFNDDVSPRSL